MLRKVKDAWYDILNRTNIFAPSAYPQTTPARGIRVLRCPRDVFRLTLFYRSPPARAQPRPAPLRARRWSWARAGGEQRRRVKPINASRATQDAANERM